MFAEELFVLDGTAGTPASNPPPVKPLEASNPPLGTSVEARFLVVETGEPVVVVVGLEDTDGAPAGISTLVFVTSISNAYMDDVRGGGARKTSD